MSSVSYRFISFPSLEIICNHGVRKIAALGHHVCRKKADRRMKKRTGRGLVWTPGHFPVVSFNWPNKDMERPHKITNFNNFMTQEILSSKQTWWNGQCMFKCWMFNGSLSTQEGPFRRQKDRYLGQHSDTPILLRPKPIVCR